MEVYQIFLSLLDKPDVPKFYRELRNHYQSVGLAHEADAIGHLIEKKFEKKHALPDHSSPDCQEQRGDG